VFDLAGVLAVDKRIRRILGGESGAVGHHDCLTFHCDFGFLQTCQRAREPSQGSYCPSRLPVQCRHSDWRCSATIMVRDPDTATQPPPQDHQLMPRRRVLGFKPQSRHEREGGGGPARNREARSSRQLRRFRHIINPDKVFGTDSGSKDPAPLISSRHAGSVFLSHRDRDDPPEDRRESSSAIATRSGCLRQRVGGERAITPEWTAQWQTACLEAIARRAQNSSS
jgi:hypothetical protein